jgi:hypothetical protein
MIKEFTYWTYVWSNVKLPHHKALERAITKHIYHSRLIAEGAAEASQIFLRDAHVLPKWQLAADVTGGKPIAV